MDRPTGTSRAGRRGRDPTRPAGENSSSVILDPPDDNVDSAVGFNPYNRIRRARMTRTGDLLYVGIFLALIAGLVIWALR